jgi:hypothetical protein
LTPFEERQREYCVDFFEKALVDPNLKEHRDINGFYFLSTNYGLYDIREFFKRIPKSTFCTIGDSYCAREAIFIKSFGHYAHACDQAIQLIKESKELGLIDDFSVQDLNELKFENESFDFVFAKETLHHLSMPYRGLYEMFRVCKKGVIIEEPNGDGGFDHIREQNRSYKDFEPVGNYCFAFRSHELSKIGVSYGFKFLAFTYTSGYNQQVADLVNNFKGGSIEEERAKLVSMDKSKPLPSQKDMIIFMFLKDKGVFDSIPDGGEFIKVSV